MPEPRQAVPCNGCTECCRHGGIVLIPEHDDPADYLTTEVDGIHLLQVKPDKSCVYLGEQGQGCTIHDRAPIVCRMFDCRDHWRKTSRAERRRLVAQGSCSKEVFHIGRRKALEGDSHA